MTAKVGDRRGTNMRLGMGSCVQTHSYKLKCFYLLCISWGEGSTESFQHGLIAVEQNTEKGNLGEVHSGLGCWWLPHEVSGGYVCHIATASELIQGSKSVCM
jgi:hypothetical protein